MPQPASPRKRKDRPLRPGPVRVRLDTAVPMNEPSTVPVESAGLPRQLLFATSARIGGIGLDLCAQEQLRLPLAGGYLGKAVAFQNRCPDIPDEKVHSLRWSRVRLLSFLDRPYYYGAKRHAAGRAARRGTALGSIRFFPRLGGRQPGKRSGRRLRRHLPTVLDIPTWHVDHGFRKHETIPPPGGVAGRFLPRRWLAGLPVRPERLREEYSRATVVLTRSTSPMRRKLSLASGFPPERVFNTDEGADVTRFQPGEPPPLFRALFVGALIQRKGVHTLLEAWHRLNLRDAELVLVGHVPRGDRAVPGEIRHPERPRRRKNRARGRPLPDGDLARFFPRSVRVVPRRRARRRHADCRRSPRASRATW